ncbi:hypothetical protein [Ammoniphilus sp. 3BR4]|uniref:hypothetical protein n=1 Tax=Ammoniphilus sp. 3BR4 TaxID=3158265 RepID=UPI003466D62E
MLPFGESAIIVDFGKGIHPDNHRNVKALTEYLEEAERLYNEREKIIQDLRTGMRLEQK